MFRRRFFSPPNQTDEPGVRVTEDPLHGLQSAKAAESISVRQTTNFA
jgi:hypothetical protein